MRFKLNRHCDLPYMGMTVGCVAWNRSLKFTLPVSSFVITSNELTFTEILPCSFPINLFNLHIKTLIHYFWWRNGAVINLVIWTKSIIKSPISVCLPLLCVASKKIHDCKVKWYRKWNSLPMTVGESQIT